MPRGHGMPRGHTENCCPILEKVLGGIPWYTYPSEKYEFVSWGYYSYIIIYIYQYMGK
jgi:hypothetical protein